MSSRFCCALPPRLRVNWAEGWARLLRPGATLITLVFPVTGGWVLPSHGWRGRGDGGGGATRITLITRITRILLTTDGCHGWVLCGGEAGGPCLPTCLRAHMANTLPPPPPSLEVMPRINLPLPPPPQVLTWMPRTWRARPFPCPPPYTAASWSPPGLSAFRWRRWWRS